MDCAQLDKSFHELVIVGDIGGGVTVFSLQEQSDQGANAFVVMFRCRLLFHYFSDCHRHRLAE
jgi:hypothetical protein